MLLEKLKSYAYLMRFHKPIGIFLLLWPTLWGLWLAGASNLSLVCIFVVGVVLMRAAGCIINDIADRRIDGHVERTRERPLVTGKVTLFEALVLFAVLLLAAFLLVLLLNPLTILLAFVGAALAVLYPFLKRITHLPQLGLGLAFAWSIPMAFAAENNAISGGGWLLFFAAVLWPIIYDTIYAMVDRDDDIKINIKSTAILFGKYDRIIISLLQSVFILVLIMVGLWFNLKVVYFITLVGVCSLFIYQQMLMKQKTRDAYFKAFLNNNWVGLLIFTGILMGNGL